mmetsp:Transcript_1201/g.1627  ORF Transcript_1201/g.1627 Transcript_1201/m.1627 type:complete len:113 (-) Transcript_1201:79-417(-)
MEDRIGWMDVSSTITLLYFSLSNFPVMSHLFVFSQVDNPERCNMCTTAFFEGQAAIMDPRESWAAKWIRVDNFLPGVYAISVTGQFDREIEEDLENRGIRWRCRPVGSSSND